MRLWHIDLIPYLPTAQLKAQWRELNSIIKKKDNHILINYVYNYDDKPFKNYTDAVLREMYNRGYKANIELYRLYFSHINTFGTERFKEHNDEYLLICFMNLYEKYIRGQKDFEKETFDKLYDFVNKKFNLKQLGIKKEK